MTPRRTVGIRRWLVSAAAAAVLAGLALPTTPAYAGPAADAAVAAWRAGDPVYVDPAADPTLSAGDRAALRGQIEAQPDLPVWVAVMPPLGSYAAVTSAASGLARQSGAVGVYLVASGQTVIGGEIGRLLPSGAAAQAVVQALGTGGRDVAGVLLASVTNVQAAAKAAGDVPAAGSSTSSRSSPFGWVVAAFVIVAVGVGGLLAVRRRAARRRQDAAALAEVRPVAQEDVVRLGEDIAGLDLDLSRRDLDAGVRDDYSAAMDAYTEAGRRLDAALRPADLALVTAALAEGRFRMECVRARLAGSPLPQRRPPCFFDPAHGPSVADVEWTPPQGQPRTVPVCQADQVRLARGEDPASRQVVVAGQQVPYWQAGPAYGPWAGGYFGGYGGAGGLLAGMVIGSALSGPGWGYGGPAVVEGGGGDGGGGSFGGGDFGGGDFGGGDFGGGDMGGGGGW